jgi:Rieske Fe-S protein
MSDDANTRNLISRREVLKAAAATGVVAVVPVLAGPGEAAAVRWVSVGTATQFKPGVPRRVLLPGGGVAFLRRIDATRLIALSARCTHQGCEVGWDAGRKQFRCPCHGATFSAAGQVTGGPAKRPLAALAVTQNGDRVQVNLASLAPGAATVTGKKEQEEDESEEHEHEEHERGQSHKKQREHDRD